MEFSCNWLLLFALKLWELRIKEFLVSFLNKLFFGILKHYLVLFVAGFAYIKIIRLCFDVFWWFLSFNIFYCLGTPPFGRRLPDNSSYCCILEIFSSLNNTKLWVMLVFLGGWDGQYLSWIEDLVNMIVCKCTSCLLKLFCNFSLPLIWHYFFLPSFAPENCEFCLIILSTVFQWISIIALF